jgi:hypothetical protein
VIRATVRNEIGKLIAAELSPLDVAFTNGFPGSLLESEHVYTIPDEGSDLEYLMSGTQVIYDDEHGVSYLVESNLSGVTHDDSLVRCEAIMQAVIDAALRPISQRDHDDIHADIIDILPTTIAGPYSETRSSGDGAVAFARIDFLIHTRTARSYLDV